MPTGLAVAITALLSLLLAVEISGRIIDGWRLAHQLNPPEPAEPPATHAEVVEIIGLAEQLLAAAPAPAPPPDPLAELIKHRYVVTLPDESTFGAVMVDTATITTDAGGLELVFTFDQCQTLPKHEGDTPETIAGRVILWASGIAYLQRVS